MTVETSYNLIKRKNIKTRILVAMATVIEWKFVMHFYAFMHSNGGNRNKIIGRVAHHIDRKIKGYQDKKKLIEKNIFGRHGYKKPYIFSHFCIFWAPSCYLSNKQLHLIHQIDRLDKS